MKPIAVLVLLFVLAGCASTPTGPTEPTLRDTKSAVQLMRNETASRVPTEVLLSVVKAEDVSVACDAGDPYRKWRSSVILNISAQRAADAPQIFADLVASYVDEGWSQGNVGSREAVMKKKSSLATIDILVTEDLDRDGDGASISVLVIGPCVMTDGADSEEVTSLENR